MSLRIIIFILILLALDFYVFQGFKFAFRNTSITTQKFVSIAFWSLTVFTTSVLLAMLIKDWSTWPKVIKTYAGAMVFIITFSKLFIILFLLTDDIFRGVK